jgi:Methyltransferase FkbM domain
MSQQTTSGGYQLRVSYDGQAVSAPPPALTPHERQARALSVLKSFEPKKAVGFDKVRLGRNFDGGYILIDDFVDVGAALSLGINDDASWDLDIAQRNIPVHQFDHTIDRGPIDHPLITFHKVAAASVDAPGALSLDSIVKRHLAGCDRRVILKIDIEGHEWEVFKAASLATLDRFAQIVCEFHLLQHIGEPGYTEMFRLVLDKLRHHFEVVHVHGNNSWPLVNVSNVALPALLEVTFANRRHYQFAETNEVFPTAIDQPNVPSVPEIRLGCFKF